MQTGRACFALRPEASVVQDSSWECEVQWGRLEQGHAFPKPKPVFQRLEGDLILEPAQVAVAA